MNEKRSSNIRSIKEEYDKKFRAVAMKQQREFTGKTGSRIRGPG